MAGESRAESVHTVVVNLSDEGCMYVVPGSVTYEQQDLVEPWQDPGSWPS